MSHRLSHLLKDSRIYWPVKLFFKRLLGRELWIRRDLDLPCKRLGGWLVYTGCLAEGSTVYACGIGKDLDFEKALIALTGSHVHAFDPTPSTVEWVSRQRVTARLDFHPWAISDTDTTLKFYPRRRKDGSASAVMYTTSAQDGVAEDVIAVPALSLATISRRLGHQHMDLIKLDIEGAEYEVLDSMLQTFVRPGQVLIEFHHRFPGIGPARTRDMVRRLRAAGYAIYAVSETGRELSFIHRDVLEQPAPTGQ